KGIAKLVVALNGNVKKSQIAAGLAWGVLLGLVPAGNFFWLVLFLVSFFFSHHHGSKCLVMAIIKLCAPLIAPPIDMLGWEILHIGALQGMFTTLYNMPFVPFTKFNNTLVAGGIAAGIILSIPLFFIFMPLIDLYRKTIGQKIRNSKIIMSIAKFPLFAAIEKAVSVMKSGK
ncbi:MAG: TIGR03546 family protein, partial [Treponema sp.]|nr:TIGR03546 family protein [Treponema sp.]